MGKQRRLSRNSGGAKAAGGGYGQLPMLLGGGAVAVCLFALLRFSGSGCTDASAVNYDPRATRDDGSCVGSIYSLSGVYELETTADGEDLESGSGGLEFDIMGTNAFVKDVKPGSDAWIAEVQVADELLAMRDEDSMLVIAGRGKEGLMEAIYKTVGARVGSKLTWVLRKATETGMADAISSSYFDENEMVIPAVSVWQKTHRRQWSIEDAETPAFANPKRPDLYWCGALTSADPTVAGLSGRTVLSELSAQAEGRLRKVKVGRDAAGSLDVVVKSQPSNIGFDIVLVTEVRLPKKTQCCSYSMQTSRYAYSDIKVGDEVLSIGGHPVARAGPDALEYAFTHASSAKIVFCVKKKIPLGKTGSSKKSQSLVSEATQIVSDPQKMKLTLSEAKKTTKLLRKASINTVGDPEPYVCCIIILPRLMHVMGMIGSCHGGAMVGICDSAAFVGAYHSALLEVVFSAGCTGSDTWPTGNCRRLTPDSKGFKEDSVKSAFRPEILELAVSALAKTFELTMDSIHAAIAQSTIEGDEEPLDMIEGALLQPGAKDMRPSAQLAKIATALMWLNRTEEACALTDLGVSEAIFTRADQACTRCIRDPDTLTQYETEGWVQRSRVQDIVDLLESNAVSIRNEYHQAVRMTRNNPNFGMFFQAQKESLAERAGSWREFELWRGGRELKYCSVFQRTCEVMRQLPEAVKSRGSVKFSTMEPGTVVRPHFAIANDHLRLHLGIDVPEPDETDLILGGERRGWEQDKVIVFDDSVVHAVKHRGSLNRTVLIVDILHPNHPDPEIGLRDTATPQELREVRRRREQWHQV